MVPFLSVLLNPIMQLASAINFGIYDVKQHYSN